MLSVGNHFQQIRTSNVSVISCTRIKRFIFKIKNVMSVKKHGGASKQFNAWLFRNLHADQNSWWEVYSARGLPLYFKQRRNFIYPTKQLEDVLNQNWIKQWANNFPTVHIAVTGKCYDKEENYFVFQFRIVKSLCFTISHTIRSKEEQRIFNGDSKLISSKFSRQLLMKIHSYCNQQ